MKIHTWKERVKPEYHSNTGITATYMQGEIDDLRLAMTNLETHNAMLRACLRGVIKVADRKTDEFDAARAALGDPS